VGFGLTVQILGLSDEGLWVRGTGWGRGIGVDRLEVVSDEN